MIDHGQDVQSEHIWRCDCGGPHFVSVSRYYSAEEHFIYFHLESADLYADLSLWERIKWMWEVLKGYSHHYCEIVLEPVTAREISDELLAAAKEYEDRDKAYYAKLRAERENNAAA